MANGRLKCTLELLVEVLCVEQAHEQPLGLKVVERRPCAGEDALPSPGYSLVICAVSSPMNSHQTVGLSLPHRHCYVS